MLASTLLMLATLSAPTPWALDYTVRVAPSLSHLDVVVCFGDRAPRFLAAGPFRGALDHVRTDHPRGRWGIDLTGVDDRTCVGYRAELKETADTVPRGVISAAEAWLLRPALDVPMTARVRFDLPPGVKVWTPWPKRGGRFELDASAFTMSSRVVLGAFETDEFEAAGAQVSVAIAGGPYRARAGERRRWLVTAIETVAALWGDLFPTRRIGIVVRPSRWGDGVPFGRAHRGGAGHVELHLGRDTPGEKLPGGWVAIHELLHLGAPWIAEPWLAEGLSTYYEEVLRARAGILSPSELWEHLVDGFERGARRGPLMLSEASRTMHRTRRYKRVYWGGAAIMLAWDVAIRRASKNQRSLDDAVRMLQPHCRSARDFDQSGVVATIDAWLGGQMLRREADAHLKQPGFERAFGVLRDLGVRREANGVILDDSAPLAEIRKAIERRGGQ